MAIDRVTTGALLDGTIATADIANLAIDDTKLANNAVTAEKMAPGAAFVTGMIMPFAGPIANQAAAPSGWLLCDGSQQLVSQYTDLKNLITTTYGAYTDGTGLGNAGTTHFILPDLRGRVIAALNNMGGGDGTGGSRVTSPEGDQLGGILGAEEHTLTAAQSALPSHSHGAGTYQANATRRTGSGGSGTHLDMPDASTTLPQTFSVTGNSGSTTQNLASEAHPLLQPTMFMNYIIKT